MEPDLISISFIKQRYISGDAIFHDLIARLYIQKSIRSDKIVHKKINPRLDQNTRHESLS